MNIVSFSHVEGDFADIPSAGMSSSRTGNRKLPPWEYVAQSHLLALLRCSGEQARSPSYFSLFTSHFSLLTSEAKNPLIPPVRWRKALYTKGFCYFHLSLHPSLHPSHISPISLLYLSRRLMYPHLSTVNLYIFCDGRDMGEIWAG